METLNVIKRNGSKEKFDIEKIHKVINWAVNDIPDVSASDVEINTKLNIQDNIPTKYIHRLLVESAANLISVQNPGYQYVASRLLSYQLRKEVWGGKTPPTLYDFIKEKIAQKVYDDSILNFYNKNDIQKIGEWIDHDRDFTFTFSGLKQLCDKYLVKNRITGEIYETPQFAYVLIAMTLFRAYPANVRNTYVKRAYNYFSKHKISLPTPVMAGVRTPLKSYSSCCLIDVDDSMNSIFSSVAAVGHATSNRYGIGVNIGRMRAINSPIKNGEIVHTGVIPFLKVFESTVKSCQQNSIRGGSATITIPIWHLEIEDVVHLKNNSGTDDNRVRKLDYSVSFSKLFYERLIKNESITLFSPHEVRPLYEAFGKPEFDDLYVKAEKDPSIKMKKVVSMRSLMSAFIKERVETGRIYITNIDHCNEHSPWLGKVNMSNLCQEVLHPLKPLKSFEDPDAEIGVCILSAINVLETKPDEYEKVCDVVVRMLDAMIDIQDYFNLAAKNFATKRRSLGIGITNFAALLAKNGLDYDAKGSLTLMHQIAERLQYFTLKASNELAQEFGPCEYYNETKYFSGILPIDTYKKSIDDLGKFAYEHDWEELRTKIAKFGLRNSTLTCQMPCESSSVIQNSTNGIDPIRDEITYKVSASNSLPVIAPKAHVWKYQKAFDMTNNIGYLNIVAIMQKFLDMSISTNVWYNYQHYQNNVLPDSIVIKEIIHAYKYGVKTMYYCNTDDGNKQSAAKNNEDKCSSGACSI